MNTNNKKNYYTDDVRAQIREMSNDDMKVLLKELEGTPTWFAILKYNLERIGVIQDSFLTLDPVKEPSKISQYQGNITGILDLQDAVLTLKFESKKAESPNAKKEEEMNEMGGAYGVI